MKNQKEKFWGIVYRIDDLTDGTFYIGLCRSKKQWYKNGYKGSGKHWKRHLYKYPDHKYKRTILKECNTCDRDLQILEITEIKKVINDPKNYNLSTVLQGQNGFCPPCKECGGKNGQHKAKCSKYRHTMYKTPEPCSHCGGLQGWHNYNCTLLEICPVCKQHNGAHKKFCSFIGKKWRFKDLKKYK